MTQENVSTDLVAQLEDKVADIVIAILENKQDFEQLDAIKTVIGWYRESKKEHDLGLSKLANRIANKLIEYVIEPLIEPLFNNISIQIQKKKVDMKFNSQLFKSELNPYVEFVKKINNSEVATVKLKFKFESELYIEGIEVKYVNKEMSVKLGTLTGTIELSIVSTTVLGLQSERPISLGRNVCTIDLPTITGEPMTSWKEWKIYKNT